MGPGNGPRRGEIPVRYLLLICTDEKATLGMT